MNSQTGGVSSHITLISAPWPLFNRPSIQLGSLKSYLRQECPDVKVTCHHFFLIMAKAVGYSTYQALSKRTWLAESVYAALLYPERQERISRFFAQQAEKSKDLKGLAFADLVERVKAASDEFIRATDWQKYDLAGFSVCLCQLTASIYFIREIRNLAPDLPLIAGGSIVSGPAAEDLLAAFPEIDLIATGEGEQSLTRLVDHLQVGGECHDFPPTTGIVRRQDDQSKSPVAFCQLEDLESLPEPDYTDYFDLLNKFPADKRFFPTLPVEFSRGCWWGGAGPDKARGKKSEGCAFCNLNLQWQGYRTRDVDRVAEEIDSLTETYQVLSVAFMDNVLPPKKSDRLFDALVEQDKSYHIFAELRATTSRRTLENYGRAGMTEVQIGIEALSSRLLKKLNKGATAMDNMEIMKHCEALGLKNSANLMVNFPGSDETDVAETLGALRFARYFCPLQIVPFWLGMHSPVWNNPEKYGLTAVFNHPNYKKLFPETVCRRTRFMIQDYRGGKTQQKQLWQPVEKAVEIWQQDYRRLHAAPYAGPILSCHDGRTFLILKERRPDAEPVNHRLEGTSRKIYLFCEHQRQFDEIKDLFSPLPADRIQTFLNMMVDKRLMFEDGGRYLSLAISTNPAD